MSVPIKAIDISEEYGHTMTEHTQIITTGAPLPASVRESAVALEEMLIKVGEALPPLAIGDVLCCQIRRRHDIFIVRQITPEIILGSVSRARRIMPKEELDTARPLVILRVPGGLATYETVVEGGYYQLLTGQEIRAVNRRWVDVHDPATPVMVGAIPRIIARYLPPAPSVPDPAV